MARSYRFTRDGMSPLTRHAGVLLLALSAARLVAAPHPDEGKVSSVKSTFIRHPLESNVSRGGEVEIPVDVIAMPGQSVELSVLDAPRYGTLVPILSRTSNRPSLVYRSDPLKRVARDEFSVRVRAEGRAWSTHRGVVRIQDHPAVLKCSPESLDFGELPCGTSRTLPLCLSNASGSDAVGRIVIPQAWFLEGDHSFVIPEGSSRIFQITFAPGKSGDFSGSLEFSPSSGDWNKIPLSGNSLPPFLVAEDRCHSIPGNALVPIILSNPATLPVVVSALPDAELTAPPFVEIAPRGTATLTVDTTRAVVPLESSRTLHVSLSSGDYKRSVEVTVRGREGAVRAEIPAECLRLQSIVNNPVRLTARLINESRSPREVSWSIRGDGHAVEGPDSGLLRLEGGESREMSFSWIPDKVGHLNPELVLGSSYKIGWELESRSVRPVAEIAGKPRNSPEPFVPVSPSGPRYPSDPERRRMVIPHPTTLEGSLYPRHLLLVWSYQGDPKTTFEIQERSAYASMSNRAGETDEGWKALAPKYVANGEHGVWGVRIPVFFPGVREFRISPAIEGERVIFSERIPLTGEQVFGPLMKALSLLAAVLMGVFLLRMRMNRRSED